MNTPSTAARSGATPARQLELPLREGCRLLPGEHESWRDGGEARVATIIRDAEDLSSMSEELARHDGDRVQRYHLSYERANVVRGLEIPADAAVLEIGAGCGAVTRYLGETATVVDALEPTPERAAIARSRTRDLPGVEVFVGGLEALPREPAYDLIVIIGVLEYVGEGGGAEPRIAFLRECAARLRNGGAVVCAIENPLGVKYLVGAPEDHAGAPFEGLEGYPRRGPYRTFARRQLEEIFTAADLAPDVHHVFPDHKLPRLVYSDALLEADTAPLAWRAARFPSYDAPLPRPPLASEGHLWRELVRAGLGGELANSFLVVARSDGPSPWPADQRAVFWSWGRRARFATASRIVATGDDVRIERSYLKRGEAERGGGGLVHACVDSRFLPGTPLSEVLEQADGADLAHWLQRWRGHAEAAMATTGRGINLDMGPQNVIVASEELVTIDEEWWHRNYDVQDILDRSLLHLAVALADARAPSRWPVGCTTVADVLAELYRAAGLTAPTEERLEVLATREAEVQAQVGDTDPGEPGWEQAVRKRGAEVREVLERPLADTRLGRRVPELLVEAAAQAAALTELQHQHSDLQEHLRETVGLLGERNRALRDLTGLHEQLTAAHRAVVQSKSWRLTWAPRRAAALLRRLRS